MSESQKTGIIPENEAQKYGISPENDCPPNPGETGITAAENSIKENGDFHVLYDNGDNFECG